MPKLSDFIFTAARNNVDTVKSITLPQSIKLNISQCINVYITNYSQAKCVFYDNYWPLVELNREIKQREVVRKSTRFSFPKLIARMPSNLRVLRKANSPKQQWKRTRQKVPKQNTFCPREPPQHNTYKIHCTRTFQFLTAKVSTKSIPMNDKFLIILYKTDRNVHKHFIFPHFHSIISHSL